MVPPQGKLAIARPLSFDYTTFSHILKARDGKNAIRQKACQTAPLTGFHESAIMHKHKHLFDIFQEE
jgi:hypothetical protein